MSRKKKAPPSASPPRRKTYHRSKVDHFNGKHNAVKHWIVRQRGAAALAVSRKFPQLRYVKHAA